MTKAGEDGRTRMGGWRKWITPVLIVVAGSTLIWYINHRRTKWKKEHLFIELRAIQTPKGWGYDILTDGKVFIHQDFIPAVPGQRAFRTREDALTVGKKVYERVMAGKQPMVTAEEVKGMGIDLDTTRR